MGLAYRRNLKKSYGEGDYVGALDTDMVRWTDQAVGVITTSGTEITNGQKIVAVSGAAEVKLPATPRDGQIHIIKDIAGTASGSPVTVQGNGKGIEAASSFSLDANNTSIAVVFVEDTNKWWYIHSRAIL